MVLEKAHDTVARWGTDSWIIEQRARYRWTDIQGRAVSDWYEKLDHALQFAIESGT